METGYSKIELLACIKKYNKTSSQNIQNVDKMKKKELYDICIKYSLIDDDIHKEAEHKINLCNIPKKDLLQNIEIFLLKRNQPFSHEITNMKKKELIDFMIINNVTHYTPDMIEKEIIDIRREEYYKNVIIYNIIRYDNVNVEEINDNKQFVEQNKLDTDITDYQEYAKMLNTMYKTFETFCKNTGKNYKSDKIKSFPKLLSNIDDVVKNKI